MLDVEIALLLYLEPHSPKQAYYEKYRRSIWKLQAFLRLCRASVQQYSGYFLLK